MRTITSLSLACLLVALAGCGDGSNAFEFKTISAEPSGEKVRILYDLKPGDGVRMKMTMSGSMAMEGPMNATIPMDMKMTMTLKCLEASPEGDKVLEMQMDAAEIDLGADMPKTAGAMLQDLKGTMTIDKNGKVTAMDFAGGDPMIEGKLSQMMNSPGFQYFVPMPAGGMQVGEALDLGAIMPAKAMEQLMSQVAGGTMKPKLEGELVLLGTREIHGEPAAEFGVNMVMNLQGSMSQGGQDVEMDMGMKIRGKQFSALRTGFPIGNASWTMTMRADMEGGGQEMEMEMNATMAIECERLE